MSVRHIVFAVVFCVVIASLGLFEGHRVARANQRLQDSRRRYDEVLQQANTIHSLLEQEEHIGSAERPKQDVYALLSMAIDAAGLRPSSLADLRNESDAPLRRTNGPPDVGSPGSTYRIQSMAFSLRDLSLSEFGAFLDRWSSMQTAWTVTRLSLTKPAASGRSSSLESVGKYDIKCVISSIYIGDSAQ